MYIKGQNIKEKIEFFNDYSKSLTEKTLYKSEFDRLII
jgi:hypothetical protein